MPSTRTRPAVRTVINIAELGLVMLVVVGWFSTCASPTNVDVAAANRESNRIVCAPAPNGAWGMWLARRIDKPAGCELTTPAARDAVHLRAGAVLDETAWWLFFPIMLVAVPLLAVGLMRRRRDLRGEFFKPSVRLAALILGSALLGLFGVVFSRAVAEVKVQAALNTDLQSICKETAVQVHRIDAAAQQVCTKSLNAQTLDECIHKDPGFMEFVANSKDNELMASGARIEARVKQNACPAPTDGPISLAQQATAAPRNLVAMLMARLSPKPSGSEAPTSSAEDGRPFHSDFVKKSGRGQVHDPDGQDPTAPPLPGSKEPPPQQVQRRIVTEKPPNPSTMGKLLCLSNPPLCAISEVLGLSLFSGKPTYEERIETEVIASQVMKGNPLTPDQIRTLLRIARRNGHLEDTLTQWDQLADSSIGSEMIHNYECYDLMLDRFPRPQACAFRPRELVQRVRATCSKDVGNGKFNETRVTRCLQACACGVTSSTCDDGCPPKG